MTRPLSDLEHECQTWLDARGALPPDDDKAWSEWSSADPELVRATLAKYRTLQQAIALWADPPEIEITPEFVAELSRAYKPARRFRKLLVPLATAAAILGVAFVTYPGKTGQPVPSAEFKPRRELRPLSESFAEIKKSSLQIALALSEPAARATQSVFERADWETPAVLPELSVDVGSAPLKEVGQSVGERVKPLGGTARKAFGFLLVPVDRRANRPMPATPETSELML